MPGSTAPRHTRQRRAIDQALVSRGGFTTAQQLHEELVRLGSPVALATVYRTLQAMHDAGEVDSLRQPDGQLGYRCCRGDHHHHHLVCRACGHTVEVEFEAVEAIVAGVAARHGFTGVEHEIELFGCCASCSKPTRAEGVHRGPERTGENGRRADLSRLRGGAADSQTR